MSSLSAARLLADYIQQLDDFEFLVSDGTAYDHAGAVLADAVLQAGLNYRAVVWPRIVHILTEYAEANTLPKFATLLKEPGAHNVLQWRHHEKPHRLVSLTDFLMSQDLITYSDMSDWMANELNRREITCVRGVGPKTVDYLCGLLGIDVIAVDRHILNFVTYAGIGNGEYNFVRDTVSYAADLLGVSRRTLDYSIWSRLSKTRQFSFLG
jgi:hypothetical protein